MEFFIYGMINVGDINDYCFDLIIIYWIYVLNNYIYLWVMYKC